MANELRNDVIGLAVGYINRKYNTNISFEAYNAFVEQIKEEEREI